METKNYSFTINEEDGSAHIATIADIPYGDKHTFLNKLFRALFEHYDGDVVVSSVPNRLFESTVSVQIRINDEWETHILIERTFIY